VGKRYHAIVHGKFPGRDEAQVYTGPIDGKTAETTASRIRFDADNNCSVLLVSIRTGRKHQIRRHLADAGFPIVGDRLHGRAENPESLGSESEHSLCLVASQLTFDDPLTGARIKCECIPREWL
jgi:23S rRNA-/tRNA-specific pseudouridylate synthase